MDTKSTVGRFNESIGFKLKISLVDGQQQPILKPDPTGSCSPFIGDPQGRDICNNNLINPDDISSTAFMLNAIGCLTDQAQKGLCAKFLGECVTPTESLTKSIVLESQLCKAACINLTNTCNNPLVGAYVNCSDSSQYPDNYTLYDLSEYGGSSSYRVECTNSLLFSNGSRNTNQYCPFPLFHVNRSDPHYSKDNGFTFVGETSCVVPCPVPIYTFVL
ncbi:hypothetical protein PPL_00856 [Heterostelium album PN500]|uniref:Uncharacterized protein n=1 Tax=Heterostelium pallidum (strain ATCC 26659 / Pp 5 / PN500) TaxID=670386 RepID=D3AYT7_HETP5|nr:hypothetical protein PPL_00856 [Heterostelium album PN500]EFA85627.1 hypothetical protein PPL_00856 [Heterostelium album PN500]|eukprot:XP_020437734.1 hypothetical protein PPL_00856 [Heterostelium album PN500]